MVILVVLAILWTPYVAALLMRRSQRGRTPAHLRPQPGRAEPSGADLGAAQDGPVWSALDDLQLTRLLSDSAPARYHRRGPSPMTRSQMLAAMPREAPA